MTKGFLAGRMVVQYCHNMKFNNLRIVIIDCPVNIAKKLYIDYELYVLFHVCVF